MLAFDNLPQMLYGNSATRNTLWQQYRRHTPFHHALIFQGPPGVGKASFAAQLTTVLLGAAKLNHDNSITLNTDEAAFRQIRNKSHPDFCHLSAQHFDNRSGTIPTEARDILLPFLARAGDSPHRIVLIDSIDDCVPQLLHALLKHLEEPPAKVLFILIVHRACRLLETVRSRGQRYLFHPLGDRDMQRAIADIAGEHSDEQQQYCRLLAEGSPGMIPMFIETDFAALENALVQMLQDPSDNSSSLHKFAALVSHAKQNNITAFRWWAERIRLYSARACVGAPLPVLPDCTQKIVQCFGNGLHSSRAREHFDKSIDLLHRIQQPPSYLDAGATMVHIAYQWHQLFAPHHLSRATHTDPRPAL